MPCMALLQRSQLPFEKSPCVLKGEALGFPVLHIINGIGGGVNEEIKNKKNSQHQKNDVD